MTQQDSSNYQLRPCPFCGEAGQLTEIEPMHYAVECSSPTCAISTRVFISAMDDARPLAVESWNRRTGHEPSAIPAAWYRGRTTPSTPYGPSEPDVELAWGDDQPPGDGWTPLYRHAPPPPAVPIDRQRLRSKIGCFMLENGMTSDNLAIALCTYFEGHRDRPKPDPETEHGWGQWASENTDRVLDELTDEVLKLIPRLAPPPEVSLVHSDIEVPCVGFEVYPDKTRGLTLEMPENMPLTIGERWIVRRVTSTKEVAP